MDRSSLLWGTSHLHWTMFGQSGDLFTERLIVSHYFIGIGWFLDLVIQTNLVNRISNLTRICDYPYPTNNHKFTAELYF